jgi:parallel beta-helix repeat protein
MYLSNCRFNAITNNNVSANIAQGIYFTTSMFNTISNNIANDNQNFDGIVLNLERNNNDIIRNTANSNVENGIHLLNSNSNTIISNTANNNKNGTFLDNSDNNDLFIGNDDCYNETGSTGNIFENAVCVTTAGLAIHMTFILLILTILEGAVIGVIFIIYFVSRREF